MSEKLKMNRVSVASDQRGAKIAIGFSNELITITLPNEKQVVCVIPDIVKDRILAVARREIIPEVMQAILDECTYSFNAEPYLWKPEPPKEIIMN